MAMFCHSPPRSKLNRILPLTTLSNGVLSYLPEPMYIQAQSRNVTALSSVKGPNPPNGGRWGRWGRCGAGLNSPNCPRPQSWTDCSLALAGGKWGKWGRRGRHLRNSSEDTVTPYSDTETGTTLHAAPDGKYCPVRIPKSACHGRTEVIQFPPSATRMVARYLKQADTLARRSFDGRDKNSEFHMGR